MAYNFSKSPVLCGICIEGLVFGIILFSRERLFLYWSEAFFCRFVFFVDDANEDVES